MEKTNGLKRRIAPYVPLTLQLVEEDGSTQARNFRLSFDFNAFVRIEELTGHEVLRGEVWKHLGNSNTLSVMLWAAMLAQHPEYDSEEGLKVVRSYMDAGNSDRIAEALVDAFIAGLPQDKQLAMRQLKEQALRENTINPMGGPAAPNPVE